MTALGLTQRADLYARVAAVDDVDSKASKSALDRLVSEAKEAAGASTGANLGTALHSFTERLDRGELARAPGVWQAHLDAYSQTMTERGVEIVPGMVELVVTLPEQLIAGTFDRLVTVPGSTLPLVADLKTGGYLDWNEIVVQLSLYAHAETIFDVLTGQHRPMPAVDRERALVMHLPARRDAHCTLWQVDLTQGWDAVQLALDVRAWRKLSGFAAPLATFPLADSGVPLELSSNGAVGIAAVAQLTAPPESASLEEQTAEWLRARVGEIVRFLNGRPLPIEWPADVPKYRVGGPTTGEQLSNLERWADRIEAQLGMPFGPSKPRPAVDAADFGGRTPTMDELLKGFANDEIEAVRDVCALHGHQLAHVRAVLGLIDAGGARFEYLDAADEGSRVLVSRVTVVPIEDEAAVALVRKHGGRAAAVARAKTIADELKRPRPRSVVDTAGDVLLAALVLAH